ncbi:aspartyl protease family protein 1-like [Andrographis paniculata]|uniref:aspartyl protease family protein 1-like n=1 Tax=Andrographis paniculata TaxID=175694 RepID=UPI0021E8CF60|nr:aspartyl protease family protein 1-like [Andrographis paniculata]
MAVSPFPVSTPPIDWTRVSVYFVFLAALVRSIIAAHGGSETLGIFGFDIHHRYSDTVREFLDVDGLPEKGSLDYYAAMAHRDRLFNARRLAGGASPPPEGHLTFLGSNETFRINTLGFLHYAIVSVGTPPLLFLVALDTGSDLFWLPCECSDCARTLNSSSGKKLDLNIYSPRTSSTSATVACNSTKCGHRRCSRTFNGCAYQALYLSTNTSTTGILVDDVLHLGSDSTPQIPVDVPITLGCGIVQTGDFLRGAAVNGLFGLGMNNLSVPSILASGGHTANSFSMCFRHEGIGRIDFGDKGTPGQNETSFNLQQSHRSYNVTITQIAVEKNVTNLEFTAIFDSGTSFTYLNDPAYSAIVESFNPQITEPRYRPPRKIIFDYCYALSPKQDSYTIPSLSLIMKGGNQFSVLAPTIGIPRQGGYAYCLAIVKSDDVNIIGQNFMSGYRLVFDREKMVLGWKESDCFTATLNNGSSNTSPVVNRNDTEAPLPRPGNRIPGPASSPEQLLPPPATRGSSSAAAALAGLEYHEANRLLVFILSIFLHLLIILSF